MLYNSHHFGVNPDKFKNDKKLKDTYEVTAISNLADGTPFVASIESKKYPFFATQFHPEKSSYVFVENKGINHSWLSLQMNRHFGDFFVYTARHNTNKFGDY